MDTTPSLDAVRIPLINQAGAITGYALVDPDDAERVAQRKWHDDRGYARSCRRENGVPRTTKMHRLILDAPNDKFVDHINGNGLDNRRSNLRLCNPLENSRNKTCAPYGPTGFWGVRRRKNRPGYQVCINIAGGRRLHVGWFDDLEEAALAYDAAAREHHGEFASLNFPDRPPHAFQPVSQRLHSGVSKPNRIEAIRGIIPKMGPYETAFSVQRLLFAAQDTGACESTEKRFKAWEKEVGCGRDSVRRYLNELVDEGLLCAVKVRMSQGRCRPTTVYGVLTEGQGQAAAELALLRLLHERSV